MLPLLAVGSGTGVVEADVSSRVLVPEGCDLEVADEDVLLSRWRVWSPSIPLLEGGRGTMASASLSFSRVWSGGDSPLSQKEKGSWP